LIKLKKFESNSKQPYTTNFSKNSVWYTLHFSLQMWTAPKLIFNVF